MKYRKPVRPIVAFDAIKEDNWQEDVRQSARHNQIMLLNVDFNTHEDVLKRLAEECSYKIIVRDGWIKLCRT